MHIALDAMGGDHATRVTVSGAIEACKEFNVDITLVGRRSAIEEELSKHKFKSSLLHIHHCEEVIAMDDTPAQAVRQKKDSSVVVSARLAAEKKVDGFVSAGNSGAAMAAALMNMGRIKGVQRPAIATYMPSSNGGCVVVDVGANVDCKPKHLFQFGLMGKFYVKDIFGRENPTIGLLSIGEEDSKGNELSLATFDMLKKSDLNFIGNIEGRDITKGKADVVICDGFVGNIVLKFGEGATEMMLKFIKEGMKAHPIAWASIPFLWPVLRDIRKKVDYTEFGGAPLLGIDGVCIISHGGSNAKAIKNAIRVAIKYAEKNVNSEIAEELAKYEITEEVEKTGTEK